MYDGMSLSMYLRGFIRKKWTITSTFIAPIEQLYLQWSKCPIFSHIFYPPILGIKSYILE